MLTIWHNPRCRKSRETLARLESAGAQVSIRRYLEDAPTLEEISSLVEQLGFKTPRTLMRTGEHIYKELGLANETSTKKMMQAMADYPILIERPVVLNGEQAIIGRPPENVDVLL